MINSTNLIKAASYAENKTEQKTWKINGGGEIDWKGR